ncbi:hypothetical protein CTAYLR_001014 [Chrysophaeum taylorii]|uniref:Uncharacterized protein n=1 Tax=Chrysophaeum taylorii TaxID=2483200 RepID=A0AAD7UHU3_9STRA|nr:hypothetical protein CTAYLR_001014 [Chrysophaeum taylorii]
MGVPTETTVAFYASKDATEMKSQVQAAQKALSAMRKLKKTPANRRQKAPAVAAAESTTFFSMSLKEEKKTEFLNEAEIIKGVESGLRFWDGTPSRQRDSLGYSFPSYGYDDDSLGSSEYDDFSDYDDNDFDEEDLVSEAPQVPETDGLADYDDAACDEDAPATLLVVYEDAQDDRDELALLPLPPQPREDDDDPYEDAQERADKPADLETYDDSQEQVDAPALLAAPLADLFQAIIPPEHHTLDDDCEKADAPALLPGFFL